MSPQHARAAPEYPRSTHEFTARSAGACGIEERRVHTAERGEAAAVEAEGRQSRDVPEAGGQGSCAGVADVSAADVEEREGEGGAAGRR
jgi:hypothetical protein